MSLHRKLLAREAEGRPVRVALIGAGKFGSMYLAQVPRTPGVHLVAIADLSPDNARANLARAGLDDVVETDDGEVAARLEAALAQRQHGAEGDRVVEAERGRRRLGQGKCRNIRLVPNLADDLDAGTAKTQFLALFLGAAFRHEDGRCDTCMLRGMCDRQSMIAARCGNDAPGHRVGRQAEQLVHRAARLGRTADLKVFHLEQQPRRCYGS